MGYSTIEPSLVKFRTDLLKICKKLLFELIFLAVVGKPRRAGIEPLYRGFVKNRGIKKANPILGRKRMLGILSAHRCLMILISFNKSNGTFNTQILQLAKRRFEFTLIPSFLLVILLF